MLKSLKPMRALVLFVCLFVVKVSSNGCPFMKPPAGSVEKFGEEPSYKDLLQEEGRQVSRNSFWMVKRNILFDMKATRLVKEGYALDIARKRAEENLEEIEMEIDLCKRSEPNCDPLSKYRTITGECNNLENPFYGSQGYKLNRFLPPKYEDNECNPTKNSKFKAKKGCSPSGPLPNARQVSATFHQDNSVPSPIATAMIYQWGMFVAHDLSFVPSSIGSKCCSGSTNESCLPIEILEGDPFYSKFNITCLNFYRSVRHCSSEPREQFNDITSFIDASTVYGSSNDQLLTLKEPDSYLMKASLTNNGKELLPKDCNGAYVAGDARAVLVSGLVSLHTLFVREHNRLARLLAKKYPTMSNHTIFEETRRIVGAINQNIIYGDFLNILLGPESMKKHRLSLQTPSSYSTDVNPTTISSFVSSAFRFGHSMIQKDVSRSAIDEFGVNYTFPLMEDFFNTKNYEDNDGKGMEELIYGLSHSPAQSADRFVVSEVTNHLFNNGKPYGSDLETKTILRGRDHGLPSYGDWREFCGLKPICDWNDRPHEIDPESWSTLKSLYSSPNDIDLHTAGLAENPIPKTVLGPTNNCIIARQFAALKEGDRFFFTHRKEAGSFSEKQIQALRGVTLSRVICDNTDIQFVYEDVFRSDSKILHCSQIPTLNIDLF